jgi:hypothetical protein
MKDKEKLEARRFYRSVRKKIGRKRKAGPSAEELMKVIELGKKFDLGGPKPANPVPPEPDTNPFGPFTAKWVGDLGYEIADADGDAVAYAVDRYWSGKILGLLNSNP